MSERALVWMGLCLLLGACGGGDDDPLDPISTLYVPAEAAVSGYVQDSGFVVAAGEVVVGDHVLQTPTGMRGFYRFDLSDLPDGAALVEVTLTTGLDRGYGEPFVQLGDLLVDHVDLGVGLDTLDFAATPLAEAIGTLATNATPEAKRVEVTAAVQADLDDARTTSDFRIRFVVLNNFDAESDRVHLTNTTELGDVGILPHLRIRYRPPLAE